MGPLLLVLVACVAQVPTDAKSPPVCLACHSIGEVGSAELAGIPHARLGSAEDVHRDLTCTECHTNVAAGGAGMGAVAEPQDDAERSMLALRGPTGLHTLRGCRSCHEAEYTAWRSSVHGRRFGAGSGARGDHSLYPAFCTDCHGAHGIRSRDDLASPTYRPTTPDTCARCHRFSQVVDTYQSSVHGQKRGLTGLGNALEVAVCADCHGTHDILGPSEEGSSVSPGRVEDTCGQCHGRANARFAASFSHRRTDDHWLLRLIRLMYIFIIGGTLSAMGVYIAADVIRTVLTRGKHVPPPEELTLTVRRWGKQVRGQHMALVAAFTLLSITGVPLMFPRSPVAIWVMALFGGPPGAALCHRLSAALLILATGLHVLWIVGQIRRGVRRSSMIPGPRDVRDMIGLALFTFGLRRERPSVGRYGPIEKFEYWSLAWGTFVMVVTGLILWFPARWAFLVGGVGIQAAQLVHALEALLAVLVILTWHMYHAHLVPESWPMSLVWITGRTTRWAMKELHAEELAELDAAAAAASGNAGTGEEGEPDAGGP